MSSTSVKLGDHIQTQKGYAFKSKWYTDCGTAIVKVSDFTKDSIDTSSLTKIPIEIAHEYGRYQLKSGDVIIQTVGSWPSNPQSVVGKVIRVPSKAENTLLNQNAVRIDPDDKIDGRYLFYLLKDDRFKDYIIGCARGAASQAGITLEAIRNFKFDLPPFETQRKISAVLSAYDDLIENNTRRIAILEEMAQALYCEWFVHFRFPGHEDVKMVEVEGYGMVPEGWILDVLGEHISVDKGVSYKGKYLTDDGIPMVNLKSVDRGGGYKEYSAKPYSGDYKLRHVVKHGDIVLANTDMTQAGNVIGSPAIVPNLATESDMIISHHLYAVRFTGHAKLPKHFLYYLLLSPEFKGFAKGRANGTTVLGLPRDGVLDFQFIRARKGVLIQFEENVLPMHSLMENLVSKNTNLRRTRDLLLPRLISGELDVSRIEVPGTSEVPGTWLEDDL